MFREGVWHLCGILKFPEVVAKCDHLRFFFWGSGQNQIKNPVPGETGGFPFFQTIKRLIPPQPESLYVLELGGLEGGAEVYDLPAEFFQDGIQPQLLVFAVKEKKAHHLARVFRNVFGDDAQAF